MKFSDWLLVREQQVPGMVDNKPDGATETLIKQTTAKLVGKPKNTRQQALKKLANDMANKPGSKPKDIAAIAAAAEEDA